MDTSKEAEPPYQMTFLQMEEAKNAEKSLPPRGSESVRLSLYHRGYSGYSLLPLPRAAVERQIVQRRRRDAKGEARVFKVVSKAGNRDAQEVPRLGRHRKLMKAKLHVTGAPDAVALCPKGRD